VHDAVAVEVAVEGELGWIVVLLVAGLGAQWALQAQGAIVLVWRCECGRHIVDR
jgi:hypothetical protein